MCSFLQIYNEKLFDLLTDAKRQHPMRVRESKVQGIFVEGLTEYVVTSAADCLKLVKRGEHNRIKRQTIMNTSSSRSHSIF